MVVTEFGLLAQGHAKGAMKHIDRIVLTSKTDMTRSLMIDFKYPPCEVLDVVRQIVSTYVIFASLAPLREKTNP